MDSLIGDGACLESQESKKRKTNNPLPEDANGNVPPVPANKLGQDELSLIFRDCCITPKDLLTFRLVEKSWRDAATGTLLQRDACSVHAFLNSTQQSADEEEGDDVSYYRDKLNLGNYENKETLLTDFVKLDIVIKNSPKFPSSTLCIYSSRYSSTNYFDHPDLILFFAHHKDKIKTICPRGNVTKDNLHDILLILTPQLECLDLSEAELISSDSDDEHKNNSKWDSQLLPFKSLVLAKMNDTDREFSHYMTRLLLASPSNLRSIKDVTLISLPDVLEAGKGHLTNSFLFGYNSDDTDVNNIQESESVRLMKQFSENNPKLSRLLLDLKYSRFYFDTLTSLNQLINSSKETMKELVILSENFELDDDPDKLLHIPSMPNLESITLNIHLNYDSHPLDDLALGLNEGKKLFSFENQVSGDKYFPSLAKVILLQQQASGNSYVEQNILCFFSEILDKNVDGTRRNYYCFGVKTLRLHNCNLPQVLFMSRLSDVFPNIRDLHLKFSLELINTSKSDSLSLWLQCPSVQLIKMYHIYIPLNIQDDMTSTFDAFFTGFSLVMCQKLRVKDLPKVIMDNPEALEFLRITPSIVDLKYLKEFQMEFSSKFSSGFASHVTGAYAFSKMENTKFVVSYDPILWKRNIERRKVAHVNEAADDDEETSDDEAAAAVENEYVDIDELCFGSLKPYVCTVHDTQND